MKRIWFALLLVGSHSFAQTETKGLYRGFTRSMNATNTHGYKIVNRPEPVRAGSQAERFELRAGDCSIGQDWNDCATDRERSEVVQSNPAIDLDQEYWFAWSLYVPKDFQNVYPVKAVLGQFIQEGIEKHPLLFQNFSGGYWMDQNQLNLPSQKLIDEPDFKGRWHDLLLHVKWSQTDQGFINVWVDDKLKFESKGKNVIGKGAIRFKYGIYRSFLSRGPKEKLLPTQVVYFDEVKWGKTRKSVIIFSKSH